MKKQVFSFLALFGLVFILSVYYILLPTNLFIKESSPVNNNLDTLGSISYTIDQSNNLFFTSLNEKLNEKHNDKIYNYESIIASSTFENEEKELAINNLNNQLKIMESEQLIASLIINEGYFNAYVEYEENIIKVIVQANSLTNEQAAQIISIVLDNSINDLYPEISYVN